VDEQGLTTGEEKMPPPILQVTDPEAETVSQLTRKATGLDRPRPPKQDRCTPAQDSRERRRHPTDQLARLMKTSTQHLPPKQCDGSSELLEKEPRVR
jgi:hypothetical protein